MCLGTAVFCYFANLLPPNLLNDYDSGFLNRQIHDRKDYEWNRWFRALADGMLAFVDMQVLQGIAILLAAFINVGSLSVYDWQIVVYLSWMSSNVHLTGLTFLRDYLNERPALMCLRLVGMMTLLGMLMVALVPTSTWNWIEATKLMFDQKNYPTDSGIGQGWFATNLAMPSHCFWRKPFNGHGDVGPYLFTSINPDAPFTYMALLVTYIWKMYALLTKRFVNPADNTKHRKDQEGFRSRPPWVKNRVLRWLAMCAKRRSYKVHPLRKKEDRRRWMDTAKFAWESFCFRVTLTTYATTLAAFDFLASFLASLWALLLLLLWGTLEVVNVRDKVLTSVHDQEKEWKFGQILPVALLAVPATAVVNHFLKDVGHKGKGEDGSQKEEDKRIAHREEQTASKGVRQRQSVAAQASKSPPAHRRDAHAQSPPARQTSEQSLDSRATLSPKRHESSQSPGLQPQSPSPRRVSEESPDSNIADVGFTRNPSHIQWNPPFASSSEETTLYETSPHASDRLSIVSEVSALPVRKAAPSPTSEKEDDVRRPEDNHYLLDYFLELPSDADAEPDEYLLSQHYFYKSKLFRSLLVLPNLMCIAGGVFAFYLEGHSAVKDGKNLSASAGFNSWDPKGWIWLYGSMIVGASVGVWIVWAAVVMFSSRLFRAADIPGVSNTKKRVKAEVNRRKSTWHGSRRDAREGKKE